MFNLNAAASELSIKGGGGQLEKRRSEAEQVKCFQ